MAAKVGQIRELGAPAGVHGPVAAWVKQHRVTNGRGLRKWRYQGEYPGGLGADRAGLTREHTACELDVTQVEPAVGLRKRCVYC